MDTVLTSLSTWFQARPKWLQLAVNKLFANPALSEQDVAELAALCRQEAVGAFADANCSLPPNTFSPCISTALRLCSINNVEGVNALAPKKPLVFGNNNLTIVYGRNGSGKSGYVRLLKHICGSRNLEVLHGNVYVAGTLNKKAIVSFEQNKTGQSFSWSENKTCHDLQGVNIFDISVGSVFVGSEGEVSYEPPILSLFSGLTSTCQKVETLIEAEINRLPSKKPIMPADLKTTEVGAWYEKISATTTLEEIAKHSQVPCPEEIKKLEQRLAENSPADKAKLLQAQKQHLDALVRETQRCVDQLSDENCQLVIAAKKKEALKKSAAGTAAKKVFSECHLGGIGTEVWKELWEAARKYSQITAYKGLEYPITTDGARCVLCQQELTDDAKKRMISFETFVQGELQREAAEATKEYEAIIRSIPDIPASDSLTTKIDATAFQKEGFAEQVIDFFRQLQIRKEWLTNGDFEKTPSVAPQLPSWIVDVKAHLVKLDELIVQYEKDSKDDDREEIKKSLNQLRAKKWLSENRASIEEETSRLKSLEQLQEAKKSTNTKAISLKKGELAEALITGAFIQRFNDELKVLGASHIKVELVKSRVDKGRVLHKIQLRGATQQTLAGVLSEGETRIISIAAFLADVASKDGQSPFIFDDPISSLDQDYEEAVAKRLIELSCTTQVIIFTHRLSLLGILRHFADKKVELHITSIRSTDWGTGEPAPLPISHGDMKQALHDLQTQRHKDVEKAFDNGEFDIAENGLKSICSDFRILVERSIENDLLCGIVQRFQRPVHTQKLKDLARLKNSDYEFLDSLMTKYSTFEHSQPAETPPRLPSLQEVKEDIVSLATWRKEYNSRTASA